MAIKQRQKDIVNPYAQDADRYNSSERSAVGYDYDSARNKFVLDAIHDSFRNLGFFPEIGLTLSPEGPLENLGPEERILSKADALAYCALYPQNAKIIADRFKLLSDDEIYNQLKKIANILASEQMSDSYETVTTSEAQFIENQTVVPSNTGRERITYDSADEQTAAARKQTIARLMSIPPVHSAKYINSLRKSLGAPEESYEIDDNLYMYNNSGLVPYTSQNTNVDLYDWRNNADPGTETTKVYYNPIDDNYYYVIRTDIMEPKDFVVSYGGILNGNQNTLPNIKGLLRQGVDEILKYTQKYSEENRVFFIDLEPTTRQALLAMERGSFMKSNDKLSVLSYMDARPSSPWVGCVRIPRIKLDTAPGGFEISYEEFEMTPFEKAKVITNKEGTKPEYKLPIQVSSLVGKLAATKKVLKKYLRDIISEGISKKLLKNVDIEREIDNLHNFVNYLQLLYNYNRISLGDDDIIEFYLTDSFRLMYVTINGNLVTRGIGNLDFIKEPAEENTNKIILDAFGLMSQTSFSFLFYSPYIFKEYLEKPDASSRSWVDFLGTYMYPPLDMTALSTQIQANKKKDAYAKNQKREQNVFQKVSEISSIPSQSLEEMYFKRPIRYRLENIESNIQCSTAQARYAKYALGIAKAFTTQTKIKSITRQVILILKNEVISDAVKRAKISIDGQELGIQNAEDLGFRYSDNPELIRRDIEKYVNERISCSLDAVGDFIEDSFLSPVGAPPAADELVRATLDPPIKFEFKEKPTFSLVDGRRKAYEKIVSGIVENFLNALLAGVIRDLVNAFLGCGPNTSLEDPKDLKSSIAQINYGGVEIREFLSDIDIVQKANEAGLTFPTPEGDIEVTFEQMSNFLDDVSKIVTPAEATALLRGDAPGHLYQVILEMVSRTQPIPVKLDTEILTESYNLINFDSDNLNVYFGLLGDGNPTTEAYSSLSPIQSYCDDKSVEASDLGLDFLPAEQLIVQFDEAMQNKMLKISFFCDFLRNALDFQAELDKLMDLIPSMGWYDDILGAISEFSNSLAESVSEWWSDLTKGEDPYPAAPNFNFYTTKFGTQTFWGTRSSFLARTTTANIPAEEIIAGQWEPWIETIIEPKFTWSVINGTAGGEDNDEIVNYSWEDKFGIPDADTHNWIKLKLPAWDDFNSNLFDANNILGSKFSQTYGTPTQVAASRQDSGYWRDDNLKRPMPRIALVLRGSNPTEEDMQNRKIKNAGIGFSIVNLSAPPELNPFGEVVTRNYNGPLLAADPLTGNREVNLDLFGTFETAAPGINYTLLTQVFMNNVAYRNLAIVPDPENNPAEYLEIDPTEDWMNNTRNQFAMNINAWAGGGVRPGGPEQTPARNSEYTKLNRNLLAYGNPYRLNEKFIETFYTIPLAQRRLPAFVRSVNKFPFDLVGDKCVTPQEEMIASSIISSIQARIARLLFNAGPLLTVYPQWGSDGTLYLLSDYLLRKMETDYKSRNLLGIVYDNFDIVEKAYSNSEEDLNRGFRFYKNRTPRENFRVLIRCVLYKMFDNISTGSEYTSINKSIFDNTDGGLNRFIQLVRSFFARQVEFHTQFNNPIDVEKWQSLLDLGSGPDGDEAQFLMAGTYFFPLAHLYAAYIITWDVANLSWGVKDLDLQLNSQKAQADDSIFTAVNGTLSEQFTKKFRKFPITVTDYENVPRTYYALDEVEDRITYLERGIDGLRAEDAPDLGLGEKEDWYFEARDNNYCTMRPGDAPDQEAYRAFMTKMFDWALEHPNRGGLAPWTSQDFDCERALIGNNHCPPDHINTFLARKAIGISRNIMNTYLNGTPPRSFCEVCDMDDSTLEQTFSYDAQSWADYAWEHSRDGGGRNHLWGHDADDHAGGHTSAAASGVILRSDIRGLFDNLCAFMSAPDLFEAARSVGLGDAAARERDRIAINIARIQSEINTLSRYI